MRVAALLATAAAVGLCAGPAAARTRPPACPEGRYLLRAPLSSAGTAVAADALTLGPVSIAIEGLCDPVAPKTFDAGRKGTKLKVVWPGCAGLAGRVRLRASVREECTTLRGVIRARRFRRRIHAARSVCGDGVTDAAGGEECDPPAAGTCSDRCRAIVTSTVGATGGRVAAPADRLVLDIPAGALPGDTAITLRRLVADELPPALREAGIETAYDLAPDELAFAAPVTATLRMDGSPLASDGTLGVALGVLATVSGDAVDVLGDLETVLDGESNTTTVSGTLTHFSGLVLTRTNASGTRVFAQLVVSSPRFNELFEPGDLFSPAVRLELIELRTDPLPVFHTDRTPGPVLTRIGPARVQMGTIEGSGDLFDRGRIVEAGGDVLPLYRCERPGRGSYQARVTVERTGVTGAVLDFLGGGRIVPLPRFSFRIPVRCVATPPAPPCGEDPLTGTCGGRCPDPIAPNCARLGSRCACLPDCPFATAFVNDVVGACRLGVCPPGQRCELRRGDDVCACVPDLAATTTSSLPATTTTSTSTTATTSSSVSTSTRLPATTSTTTTTTTTLPAPGSCCECDPPQGCASGPTLTSQSCPVACSPQPGRFVPGAVCSLATGNCEPLATTTTVTAPPGTTSSTSVSAPTTSTTTPPTTGPCRTVESDGRRLCVGTCPVTGDECRALGFRQSCGCQPIATFQPCSCLAATNRCSASTSGCRNPDEVCTIPGGDPRFDPCVPGQCRCVVPAD